MCEKVFKNVNESKVQREILKLPYLVLSVSLLLTIGATYIFYQSAQAKDISRFQSEATSLKNRIEILVGTYIAMIKASRGFVESTEKLNREKFADFVNSLELVKNYQGIQGIGFTKRLLKGEEQAFTEKMRAGEGYSEFKIFPEGERPEYQTIIYLEPLNELNRRAIGFDMSTERVRAEALERACNSGEAVATGKVVLVQESGGGADKQSGFLIYLPVYKGGRTPQTVEERRQLLDGFVYSPFRAGNFLRDVQSRMSISDIALTIYESEQKPENILAQTDMAAGSTRTGEYKTSSEVDVAGRKWIIEYETLSSFQTQSSTGWTPLIFISGLIFSLLLFGMTYLESYARAKAENITSELKESEREKGLLLEREQMERRRAEEASKAKDEFISIVSHELRTPLNSIAGWSKILYAENLSPTTKKQALQKIDKNLRIQTKIVEDLLDFSQILSGKSDLSRQQIDFSKMFEEAFSQVNALAQEKRITLVKENRLNGQKIVGDRQRLEGVIKNLLSNAVKFTPEGGKVFTEIQEKDSLIEMTIRDTGQGIKPEFLPHIFERFRQADSSSTRRYGGLGLGLAISNHIVKLHGGSIEAASEGEGKGAIFTVRLPFRKEEHPN